MSSSTTVSLLDDDACRGVGLFWGDWNHYTLPGGIAYEAAHEFGGPWRVEKLKAYDLVHGEVAVGVIYECTSNSSQLAAQQVSFGYIAFWVAYFEVAPCFGGSPP